jgi:hypothetical protein
MEGHGYYTSHSQAQETYGELGIEWLEQEAAEVTPPTEPLPFVISDMGAAGGGNSLAPMRRALAARRGGGAALVVHTDIASNDFSSLFELVADSPATYLGETGVFALAEGRSFYEPLFPPDFLSLGWSSICRRLAQLPRCQGTRAAPDGEAGGGRGSGARRRQQRRRGADGHGQPGAAGTGGRRPASSGRVRTNDHPDLEPDHGRVHRSLRLGQPPRAASSRGAHTPRRHLAAYRDEGILDRYVAAVAGFFRAAFSDSLWAALDPTTSQSRKEQIATRFDELLKRRIAADPEAAACEWHVVVLDIVKP